MTHRSNLRQNTHHQEPSPLTPGVQTSSPASTAAGRESAAGRDMTGRQNLAAHDAYDATGMEATARPEAQSKMSGPTRGGGAQVPPPQFASAVRPSRIEAALLPELPTEIWTLILGASDLATQRSLRATSRATCALTDTYTPAHLAEAVAAYWLQSGGRIPPGMTEAAAAAHLARLHTLETITRFGDVTLETLRGLLARCPNLQELDLFSKPMTWAEVCDVGLETLTSLRYLTLNIEDTDVYTSEASLPKVFGRLRRLNIDVVSALTTDESPTSTVSFASLLALPMQALRSLQELSLTADVELTVDHIRSIAPPVPELLRSFSLDTAAGIEPEARSLLMRQLNKTTNLQKLTLINCPITCADMQAFASGDRSALRKLSVRNGDLDLAGAVALSCMQAPQLNALTLEGETLTSAAVESLNLAGFPRLEILVLSRTTFSEAACSNLGAQAPAQVHTLLLRDCAIEGPGLRALQLDAWNNLRELDLTTNPLDSEIALTTDALNGAVDTARQARRLPRIRFRGLLALQPGFFERPSAMLLDAAGRTRALQKNFYWSALPQLESLSLEGCALDDDLVAGLFLADMPRLKEVNLRRNSLSAAALAAVLRETRPNLEFLDLSGCNFRDYTAAPEETSKVMAATWSTRVPKLAALKLSSAGLTVEKLRGLHLETIGGLRELDLSNNSLGPNALEAFADQILPNLTHLDLHNSLAPITGQPIRQELAVEPVSMPSLEQLKLNHTAVAERSVVLNVSLGAVRHAGNHKHAHKLYTTAACKIGPTAIIDCDKLTEISLCEVPDLTTSRFALRAFPYLRTIDFDPDQSVAPFDVVPWAAQAPRLRKIASQLRDEGFLLAASYPDLFFESHFSPED